MPTQNCAWLVQATVRGETLARLEGACASLGKPLYRINVVPFSEEMPSDLPAVAGPFVFYGYTTLLLNAFKSPRWRPGVFFDPDTFKPSRYLSGWGRENLLNGDAQIMTMTQFARYRDTLPSTEWFVKPDDDLKRFTGAVMTHEQYRRWYQGIAALDDMADISPETEIVVCAPKNVGHEWRVFLLDGAIIGHSCYSAQDLNFALPPELAEFAVTMARLWSPAPAFALDVTCGAGGQPLIVEANCINGSGLYHTDTHRWVRALSLYQEQTWAG